MDGVCVIFIADHDNTEARAAGSILTETDMEDNSEIYASINALIRDSIIADKRIAICSIPQSLSIR